jgi:hypothetical protein
MLGDPLVDIASWSHISMGAFGRQLFGNLALSD